VQIDGPILLLQQIDVNGQLLDEWSMTKPTPSATQPAD
jgi:hypothetical protein